MKKRIVVFSLLCLITIFSTAVRAVIVEFPLDDPPQYEREIGPMIIQHSSLIDLYVANIYDEQRWKDWKIIIGVLHGDPALEKILVDYDNTPDHRSPIALFEVSLAFYGLIDFMGTQYDGYYADTWLPEWAQFGTSPVGSGGLYPFGNPAWVSFHFDVEVDPLIYIKDACIPEPATICMLGLGVLGLLKKRRA